jgi:hypothetical protein
LSVVNHLAEAAAVILLIELIVGILIFAGISGGLAFGLRWVRGKTGGAFEKANAYVRIGAQYIHTGTDYAAKPFILTSAFAEKLRSLPRAIQEQVRRSRESGAATPPSPVAASPSPTAEPSPETESSVPLD